MPPHWRDVILVNLGIADVDVRDPCFFDIDSSVMARRRASVFRLHRFQPPLATGVVHFPSYAPAGAVGRGGAMNKDQVKGTAKDIAGKVQRRSAK
jgi:hypothetical protein